MPESRFQKTTCSQLQQKEFAETFGIEEKHAYTALDEAASTLYERDIKTYDGKYRERFRWVCGVRYHDNEGRLL